MARDSRLWGQDAGEFNPDRWLNKPKMSDFVFPSFNGGPRICLGKDMAIMELRVVVITWLLKGVRLRKVQKETGFVPEFPQATLKVKGKVPMHVEMAPPLM